MTLGLSEAQKAERKLRLHAGDAASIMAGDYRAVWARFQPGYVEDDLSNVFRVILGSYTEPFNLAVTMRETGRPIAYYSANPLMRIVWLELNAATARKACEAQQSFCEYPKCQGCGYAPVVAEELVVCKRHPFMACNLDGMTTTPEGHRSVIDAKHVGRSGEAEILRYTPAGVWQATCAGTDWWGLSIICGNKWEPPVFQAVDPLYQAEMIARATECWGYVERGEEPPEAEAAPVLAPKPVPRLRSLHVPVEEDEVWEAMVRQDNWLSEARDHIRAIIGTDAAAKVNAIHRSDMKELVPVEVGEIVLGRYKFHRTKAGSVTQAVAKLEEE
jgi:hypothetical protein